MKKTEHNNWKNIRNKKLQEYLVFSYIISILLIGFIIIDTFLNHELMPGQFFYYSLILPLLYIIVYIFTKYIKNINILSVPTKINYLLYLVFITLLTLIIYIGFNYNKYLSNIFYFIPLILGTVNYGQKFGFYIAGYSCINLLLLNILLWDFTNLDLDFLIVFIFLWVAWLIGKLIELEREVQEKLRQLSITDSLTGIPNFRYFQNILDSWIGEAEEKEVPLSLAIMDIDNFKSFNDSVGHQEGDELLKEIAKLIEQQIDENIFLARYGGDEFTFLLYNYTRNKAYEKIKEIKYNLQKKLEIPFLELLDKKITFSFGIASFPRQTRDKNKLFDKADQALYQAKSAQKDNIEVYHEALTELASELKEPNIEKFNSVRTLLSIINAKDQYTYGHSQRVMNYAEKFARKIKLNSTEKRKLMFGAFLHDIGKIDIPRKTLMKTGLLDKKEWEKIKRHPEIGAQILKPLKFNEEIISMVKHHHENIDGSGYCEGITGKNITYYAKILRIIDSYDAMITDRPYSSALNKREAIRELEKNSGKEFDSELVKIFIDIISEMDKTNII
ncbi:MAG: diguanylate cyclase domain-containing protein [bacterium]